MSNDQPEQRRTSLAVWLIVAAFLLPIAYVFSPGPAYWLVAHGYMDVETFKSLTWKLAKLYDNCPPVTAFYDSYFTLLGLRP